MGIVFGHSALDHGTAGQYFLAVAMKSNGEKMKSINPVRLICFSFIAASLLSGCILPKDLSGQTFKRSDGDSQYTFGSKSAVFQMKMDHSLFEAELDGHGTQVFMTPSVDVKAMALYHVIAGNSTQYFERLFLLPLGERLSCNTYGQLKDSEGNLAYEIYDSSFQTNLQRYDLVRLCQEAKDRSWYFAFSQSVEGEEKSEEEALASIQSMLNSQSGGEFFLVLSSTPHVAYSAGEDVQVADIPVEYDKNTVSINWYDASYRYPIAGAMKTKLEAWLTTNDRIIFRVEDDDRFLFNPETSSRWKRL